MGHSCGAFATRAGAGIANQYDILKPKAGVSYYSDEFRLACKKVRATYFREIVRAAETADHIKSFMEKDLNLAVDNVSDLGTKRNDFGIEAIAIIETVGE